MSEERAIASKLLDMIERTHEQNVRVVEMFGRVVGSLRKMHEKQDADPTRADIVRIIEQRFREHDGCCAKRSEQIDDADAERGGHLVGKALAALAETRGDVTKALEESKAAKKAAEETKKAFDSLKIWFVTVSAVVAGAASYVGWIIAHIK